MKVSLLWFVALVALVASTARATSIPWVPIAARVDRAELIVVGSITMNTENKYKIPIERTRRGQKHAPKQIVHEATLTVSEVLKGKLEHVSTARKADGTNVMNVRLLHDGLIEYDNGTFGGRTWSGVKVGNEGVWFLLPGEMERTYRTYLPHRLLLTQLDYVRRCLRAIENNYAGFTPAFPSQESWVTVFGLNRSWRTQACAHADGDVSVSGEFEGQMLINGWKAARSPARDRFLARLDSRGQVKWFRALGANSSFNPIIVAGHGGATLLVGSVDRQCTILGTSVTWQGDGAWLVACVSGDGRLMWTRTVELGFRQVPQPGLFVNPNETGRPDQYGSIHAMDVVPVPGGYRLVGSYWGDIVCDGNHIRSRNGTDWFIGTVDTAGAVTDFRSIERDRDERTTHAVVGRQGRVITSGIMRATPETSYLFVASISPVGTVEWQDTLRLGEHDYMGYIGGGNNGSVAVTLYRPSPGKPIELPTLLLWSETGKRLWSVRHAGPIVDIDDNGNVYCLGEYGVHGGGLKRADLPEPIGDCDMFLECYDRRGKRLWVRRDGGMSSERPMTLEILSNGRALLAGHIAARSFLAGRVVTAPGGEGAFIMNVPLPSLPLRQ